MSTEAAKMTWTSLQQDVLAYCERQDADTVAQIPRMIMLAENRLASEVRGLGNLRTLNGTMEAGNPAVRKPESWRETASINIFVGTKRKTLFKRNYEFCRAYCPDASYKDVPRYYADYDFSNFLIVPSPKATYDFELKFFEKPTPLSDENQTNWTTVHAPQLLLYATLLEAQVFLKQDTRIEVIKSFYLQASQSIMGEAARSEADGSSGREE